MFAALLSVIDRNLNFPRLLRYPINLIGILPLFAGFILRFWAGSTFYKQKLKIISIKASNKLIISGPYKYSRNPLYLGFILIGLGYSLIFDSLSSLVLLTIGSVFGHFYVILHEEKTLVKAFGKEYLKYKEKVRRWI